VHPHGRVAEGRCRMPPGWGPGADRLLARLGSSILVPVHPDPPPRTGAAVPRESTGCPGWSRDDCWPAGRRVVWERARRFSPAGLPASPEWRNSIPQAAPE